MTHPYDLLGLLAVSALVAAAALAARLVVSVALGIIGLLTAECVVTGIDATPIERRRAARL